MAFSENISFILAFMFACAFITISIFANFATPFLSSRLIAPSHSILWFFFDFSGLLIALFIVSSKKLRIKISTMFLNRFNSIKFIHILLFGLFLRFLWIVLFPAVPTSDGRTYMYLANELAEGREFLIAGTRAYWPPGYPFLLTPFVWLFGNGKTAIISLNSLLYIIGITGTWYFAKSINGYKAGVLAAMAFAIWPNLISMMGVPTKEQAIITFLPWAAVLLYRFMIDLKYLQILLGGMIAGIAALVQPSIMLWPAVCFVILWICNSLRLALTGSLIFALGMVISISPWTVRNAIIFNTFLPISSNGGSNLYRANNPLATGGYISHGEIDLSAFSELEKNRLGSKFAKEWIISHPKDFLLLSIEKTIRFMGDDAAGIYTSLKMGGSEKNRLIYPLMKLIANLFWMVFWVLIAAAAVGKINRNFVKQPGWTIPVLTFLYFFTIHSIFESTGKYHVPAIWGLCTIFGFLYSKTDETKYADIQ